jgi:hypothetical protein
MEMQTQGLNYGNPAYLNFTGEMTISFWMRMTNYTSGVLNYILGKGDGTTGWAIGINKNYSICGTRQGALFMAPGGGATGLCSKDEIDLNQWNHIAVTFDGTSETILYVNGEVQSIDTTNPILYATAQPLKLFKRANDFGPIPAVLDELGIWNAKLNFDEIETIYHFQKAQHAVAFESRVINSWAPATMWQSLNVNTPFAYFKEITGDVNGDTIADSEDFDQYSSMSNTSSQGLVGLWHLNATAATAGGNNDVLDYSGNDVHLEGNSGVTYDLFGPFKRSVEFSTAGSGHLTANDTSKLAFDSADAFSASVWVKGNLGASGAMVAKMVPGSPYTGWDFMVKADGTIVSHLISDWTAVPKDAIKHTGTINIMDGKWHHVVMTYDGSQSATGHKLYVDGVQDTAAVPDEDNLTGSIIDLSTYFSIGSRSGGLNYFDGSIDEVSVWDRELSSADVLNLYARNLNRVFYQVRSCDDINCDLEKWMGPDGTENTYYSELYNRKIAGSYNPVGPVQITAPSFEFADFVAPLNNQYFQYRFFLQTDDDRGLCSGNICVPAVDKVEAVK